MLSVNAARAAPAATGHGPQITDRLGGAIGIPRSTDRPDAATNATVHDREWWRAKARCAGSDWPGVLALHAAVVALWRRQHDPDYGGAA
jgi:hypothetical protein